MPSQDSMKKLVSSLTLYMHKASVGQGERFEKSAKWFVVDPSAPGPEGVPYETFEDAERARMAKQDCNQHTLGALTLMLDMSTGDGWNGTPVEAVHVVNKKTTVIGKRGQTPFWWEYSGDDYNTFIVVVPNITKAKRSPKRVKAKRSPK